MLRGVMKRIVHASYCISVLAGSDELLIAVGRILDKKVHL